jgi:hypothetical protein
MGRFDFVKYDEAALEQQIDFKVNAEHLEIKVESIGNEFRGRAQVNNVEHFHSMNRNKARAMSALEDFYTYCGKAIRDEQLLRNANTEKQEERTNG